MPIEARFTVKGLTREIPFTIVEGETDKLFLYSLLDEIEYKYPLTNENV